jgi:hypothetical protein
VLHVVILVIFLVRIASTYSYFNATYDEHTHIRDGIRYLERGFYRADGIQAPLPRVLVGLLPFLSGYQPEGSWLVDNWDKQDIAEYWNCLTLGRLGNLPLAVLAFCCTVIWTRRMYGEIAALAAGVLLSFSPTILGHAGLATPDLGGAAGVLLTLWALWEWRSQPSFGRAVMSGAALGLAQSSKVSACGFLLGPALLVGWSVWKRLAVRGKVIAMHAVAFALTAAIVIWAMYGFEVSEVHSWRHADALQAQGATVSSLGRWLQGRTLPAPTFWQAFVDMGYVQRDGHPAFLLGEFRQRGWWYYFPVALVLKVTPGLLLLAVLSWALQYSAGGKVRQAALYVAFAACWILVVSMPSSVNIGVRHILPVIPLLAVLACGAFSGEFLKRPWVRTVAILLLGSHVAESLYVHPDYLAYFNPAVRQHDYRYLGDSNLAWGQDKSRLAKWLAERPDRDILVLVHGDILSRTVMPKASSEPEWVVLDTTQMSILEFGEQQGALSKLVGMKPDRRIGRSILVFHLPRPNGPAAEAR